MRLTYGLGARNEVRSVAIHIDRKPLSTRAWPTGRTHKFIVDGPCRSNARCSRTMLVIFSSIVSVPELAAAQSFVAFTTIASRAGRTRAARCLLAQHPRHTPMRGHVRPDAGEVGVEKCKWAPHGHADVCLCQSISHHTQNGIKSGAPPAHNCPRTRVPVPPPQLARGPSHLRISCSPCAKRHCAAKRQWPSWKLRQIFFL